MLLDQRLQTVQKWPDTIVNHGVAPDQLTVVNSEDMVGVHITVGPGYWVDKLDNRDARIRDRLDFYHSTAS
jgi:hypothetical protein